MIDSTVLKYNMVNSPSHGRKTADGDVVIRGGGGEISEWGKSWTTACGFRTKIDDRVFRVSVCGFDPFRWNPRVKGVNCGLKYVLHRSRRPWVGIYFFNFASGIADVRQSAIACKLLKHVNRFTRDIYDNNDN